ncbi:TIGR04282 family arsenosugar biosynthesis glycosyltransferase [Maridesulfovibrio sp.]|uniref:TIGR04282 family arsenosugar biosynthesis glycosyltransferase n=1 Tax=Maridesulfovibrio sp. TaxID=2795000 RepID=UPI002A186D9A|nr:TIGR04282 family arsenosugar biosynthesis glycosyltransferase [Maridesulfovibrio sp.]
MRNALLFFVKYPEPGRVKTRLGREIGYEHAARLYKSFTEDMLSNFRQHGMNTLIFCDPYRPVEQYRNWLGEGSYFRQQGCDLGERMKNAFETGFAEGLLHCILTGSDLPGLAPQTVSDGFERLKTSPACIGPACDGGYYLIGFQRGSFKESVFIDMLWSTPEVFAETVARLSGEGMEPAVLPELSDVDTLADLAALAADNSADRRCPRTMDTVRELIAAGRFNGTPLPIRS